MAAKAAEIVPMAVVALEVNTADVIGYELRGTTGAVGYKVLAIGGGGLGGVGGGGLGGLGGGGAGLISVMVRAKLEVPSKRVLEVR